MQWVREYMRLPFAPRGRDRQGVDCYGLVRLVLSERFGLEPPSYDYALPDDAAELGALVRGVEHSWKKVPSGSERPGDVVLLRLRGQPMHVGVVAARPWMLHIMEGINSALERYDSIIWTKRVLGFYRWGCP